MNSDSANLEEVIGYKFKNPKLRDQALTHSSYANEHHCEDNERLEFLGDAVLELASSEFLFRKMPDVPEGQLTKTRASFVCEKALDEVARRIGFEKFVKLGKGEERTGGRDRASVVSDAFEALIAAIYLDGGFASAKEFIVKNIFADLDKKFFLDSKTMLQEYLQSKGYSDPDYEVIRENGPDHDKTYTIEVSVTRDGVREVLGTGEDSSKKHAAQAAAEAALKKLGKM